MIRKKIRKGKTQGGQENGAVETHIIMELEGQIKHFQSMSQE